MTISPQNLSIEEWAIVEATVTENCESVADWPRAYQWAIGRIEARRALFTPESEKPAPVAAGEISELDDRHMRLASPEAQAKFREAHGLSRPVQPGDCENCESLIAERDELRDQLDRIPDSQPVAAVRMTEELDAVLDYLEEHCDWTDSRENGPVHTAAESHHARACIAAVRAQAAAQPGKMVKLAKVRGLIEEAKSYDERKIRRLALAALAELDAYEGKEGG